MKNVFPFEDIGPDLDLVPLAGRRALDHAGLRLSLEGWRSLTPDDRARIVLAGGADSVDGALVAEIVRYADPPAKPIEPSLDPSPDKLPDGIVDLLRGTRGIDAKVWASLSGFQRFVIAHAFRRAGARGDRAVLEAALEAILAPQVARFPAEPSPATLSSHLGPSGDVRMVDVAGKAPTARRAVARSRVRMRRETAEKLARGDTPKGEVLATARIAGIMAAKRTPELIPMCHALALTHVAIEIDCDAERALVTILASAEAVDRTGVEMEAMVAASIAALTVYDMLKGIDREMVVEDVALLEKSGGKSGHFRRST